MTHGLEYTNTMPEKRIFAKSGHVCMVCGFKATTKNKYRELQDHLVRQHFQDRIKAALPTRRPFMCPDHSCNVEGKDWQALMRHYTGKHGVLEAYIKEFMASQMEHKENLHLGGRVSPLPPTNKIGCRRKRYKRHSSGDADPMAAEDRTEDTPPVISSTSLPTTYEPNHSEVASALAATSACEYITQDDIITTTSVSSSPPGLTDLESEGSNTILQLDESDPAPIPPTHLALVLKKRKLGKDGVEEGEPEETYAFVDLKYFQPLSANQYLMKSQVIDSNLLALNQHDFSDALGGVAAPNNVQDHHLAPPPPLISNGANSGGCYFLESSVQSPASTAAAAIENQPASTASMAVSADYFESFPTTSTSTYSVGSNSQIYIGDHAFRECYDQVVPNNLQSPPNCATEVEVSSNEAVLEATPTSQEGPNPVVMQVPITNSSSVATVSVMDPKGLSGRGCSKVVVETVKSIPMEATGVASGGVASYELISHEGLNGMKEIDFTMF